MPIYEYACEVCGGREERLERLDAPETHDCPACGRPSGMRRQVSRAAFMLSGGGWYASGYGDATQPGSATPAPETPSGASAPATCASGCGCHGAPASAAPTGNTSLTP